MTREQDLNRYLIGTTVFRCHPQGPRGHGVSLRGAMMTRILIARSGDRSVDEVFEHLSSLPNAKAKPSISAVLYRQAWVEMTRSLCLSGICQPPLCDHCDTLSLHAQALKVLALTLRWASK